MGKILARPAMLTIFNVVVDNSFKFIDFIQLNRRASKRSSAIIFGFLNQRSVASATRALSWPDIKIAVAQPKQVAANKSGCID